MKAASGQQGQVFRPAAEHKAQSEARGKPDLLNDARTVNYYFCIGAAFSSFAFVSSAQTLIYDVSAGASTRLQDRSVPVEWMSHHHGTCQGESYFVILLVIAINDSPF